MVIRMGQDWDKRLRMTVKNKKPGFKYRYVREENIDVCEATGWEVDHEAKEGKKSGETITKKAGLTLMKMPEKLYKEREKDKLEYNQTLQSAVPAEMVKMNRELKGKLGNDTPETWIKSSKGLNAKEDINE